MFIVEVVQILVRELSNVIPLNVATAEDGSIERVTAPATYTNSPVQHLSRLLPGRKIELIQYLVLHRLQQGKGKSAVVKCLIDP